MEKTEAVGRLKKAGYQVQFDSSIVSVLLPVGVNTNQEIRKLRQFLREIGYEASFGVRQIKESSIQEEEDSTEALEPQVEIGEQFSLEDFGIS
ncbi:MAG: hypothetical protein PUI41_00640 [Lachnospiraceae bacterium]|nr:hypothetical protein [Lachnospiraceae bacterium]MDD7049419.1 hypothetical protein [Lachnospiraceae bacterium]MDY4097247.1 hypothetical protein [Lachnospiraceae bacterium]